MAWEILHYWWQNTLAVAAQRQGNQALVNLKVLIAFARSHPSTRSRSKGSSCLESIGIQVDRFITRGEGSDSTARKSFSNPVTKWKDDLANFDPTGWKIHLLRQTFQANLEKLAPLSADAVNVQDVMLTVSTLQDILSRMRISKRPKRNLARATRNSQKNPEKPAEPNNRNWYGKTYGQLDESYREKDRWAWIQQNEAKQLLVLTKPPLLQSKLKISGSSQSSL